MPLLLAFDTATKHCAVVLCDGARPIALREDASEQFNHAERLNVFIQVVMDEAGRSLKELDAVAVGIGPGSFTGLRIGLSAAKGLCFALDIPLIGMSTLDVLVQEINASRLTPHADDHLYPMIDARRMEVFTRAYDLSGKALTETTPLILDEAWCDALPRETRTIMFGDGSDKAGDLWKSHEHITHVVGVRPSVKGLAACANAYFQEKRFSDLAYLVPEYGKEAKVTQPKKRTA